MAKQCYCFLERFNNYFNRKLIKYDTLEDYEANSQTAFVPTDDSGRMLPFDFNPNDNITTEIIVNDVPFDPDYFLLLDEEEKIVSRWFVLEQKRNRKGQWLYLLRRDVLADSLDNLNDSPVYVERGVINDISSPLLLNNEDLRVNQIKKKEILLKDATNCAWLVLYLKKGVLGNASIGPDNNGKIPIDIPNNQVYVYEELSTPIAQWQYFDYTTTDFLVNDSSYLEIQYHDTTRNCYYKIKEDGSTSLEKVLTTIFTPWPPSNLAIGIPEEYNDKTRLNNEFIPNILSLMNNANSAFSYHKTNSLLAYNGKIIKDSNGKFFEVTVNRLSGGSKKHNVTNADASALKAQMNNYWNTAFEQTAVANDDAFKFSVEYSGWRVSLKERTDIQTSVDLGAYSGKGTADSALFDAICLPYGDLEMFIGTEVSVDTKASADRSMKIMNSIATALTSQYVLDLQILPYCPCQNLINDSFFDEGGIFVPEDEAGEIILAGNNGTTTDFLLVCHNSNFTLDIEQPINIEIEDEVSDTFKTKYINDCTMLRLCSPNYNGLFEMNLAKNGGAISSFNVDVTLRPFNPYIHVNPNFTFLYGQDFNDVRGLICNGDFSLGIINDAWNVYEIQNKNYQAIFDRQIQNLDLNNAINMQEATWGAVAGTVQGAGSGAVAGGMLGGGYGAIAGAVIGGVASGVGGVLDIQNLEKRQQETRNYAIDNYNLQLGNIRALPNSITKTSALTFNNKLFPFVEIYECSDIEREAYFNKLKYNGMSVRIIDKFVSYCSGDASQYFRGRLIRMTNISEDNHYVETINEELMKGVYI
ncbi:MAG: hypothetical protein J6S85_07310 [Methanobrevibacter sp.]|nr:hypothetical protein [Methanobrevibacter sp.]